ncbi:MAG: phage terminase small subunit P27 family [Gammaproteobacteria bacterium]
MVKGRKPTPTNLRLLHGNPGKRPVPKKEPRPSVTFLRTPADLSDEAKRHWRRFARPLYEAGILTELDGLALRMLCEALVLWEEAGREVEREGLVIPGYNGNLVISPYARIANTAFDQVTRLLAEFGMTPASRTRIKTGRAPADPNAVDLFGF